MPVENCDVVDAVATHPERAYVLLSIADHLGWDRPEEHLATLQQKLNRYLAFIESGELLKKFPAAGGKAVRIEISFLNDLPSEAQVFLEQARAVIVGAGFALEWQARAVEDRSR